MSTVFHSLQPTTRISDAAQKFKKASQAEGRRVFGMIVVDENSKLVGIISMYDLLLFFQPKHVHIWGEMSDIDISGLFGNICSRSQNITVNDIMSTNVVSVDADTHLFSILELMNRKHIRWVPVVENGNVIGIVYISDLFFHMVEKII